MKVVTLKALVREPAGSADARRTRSAGQLPAVVYGEGVTPSHITVDSATFRRAVESGARVIDLDIEEGADTRVLLKDLQYDALGLKLLHADFLRLSANKKIELAVPMDLLGTPKGVQQGGVLTMQSGTVNVRCLPGDIPENVAIDVSQMEMGASFQAGDLVLPENVELAGDADQVLFSVMVPRGLKGQAGDDDEGETGDGDAAEAGSGE